MREVLIFILTVLILPTVFSVHYCKEIKLAGLPSTSIPVAVRLNLTSWQHYPNLSTVILVPGKCFTQNDSNSVEFDLVPVKQVDDNQLEDFNLVFMANDPIYSLYYEQGSKVEINYYSGFVHNEYNQITTDYYETALGDDYYNEGHHFKLQKWISLRNNINWAHTGWGGRFLFLTGIDGLKAFSNCSDLKKTFEGRLTAVWTAYCNENTSSVSFVFFKHWPFMKVEVRQEGNAKYVPSVYSFIQGEKDNSNEFKHAEVINEELKISGFSWQVINNFEPWFVYWKQGGSEALGAFWKLLRAGDDGSLRFYHNQYDGFVFIADSSGEGAWKEENIDSWYEYDFYLGTFEYSSTPYDELVQKYFPVLNYSCDLSDEKVETVLNFTVVSGDKKVNVTVVNLGTDLHNVIISTNLGNQSKNLTEEPLSVFKQNQSMTFTVNASPGVYDFNLSVFSTEGVFNYSTITAVYADSVVNASANCSFLETVNCSVVKEVNRNYINKEHETIEVFDDKLNDSFLLEPNSSKEFHYFESTEGCEIVKAYDRKQDDSKQSTTDAAYSILEAVLYNPFEVNLTITSDDFQQNLTQSFTIEPREYYLLEVPVVKKAVSVEVINEEQDYSKQSTLSNVFIKRTLLVTNNDSIPYTVSIGSSSVFVNADSSTIAEVEDSLMPITLINKSYEFLESSLERQKFLVHFSVNNSAFSLRVLPKELCDEAWDECEVEEVLIPLGESNLTVNGSAKLVNYSFEWITGAVKPNKEAIVLVYLKAFSKEQVTLSLPVVSRKGWECNQSSKVALNPGENTVKVASCSSIPVVLFYLNDSCFEVRNLDDSLGFNFSVDDEVISQKGFLPPWSSKVFCKEKKVNELEVANTSEENLTSVKVQSKQILEEKPKRFTSSAIVSFNLKSIVLGLLLIVVSSIGLVSYRKLKKKAT